MTPVRRIAPLAIALLTLAPFVAACSSDTKENAKQTATDLKDDAKDNAGKVADEADTKAAEAKARVAAEDLRARIKANKTADDQGARSVAAIKESLADVAGSPKAVGLTDADRDGLDDDGKVQLDVDGASACLTLPATGEDTTVKGGAC